MIDTQFCLMEQDEIIYGLRMMIIISDTNYIKTSY